MWKKFIRTLTSVLPIDRRRTGACNGCGACCKLPFRCWFLRDRGDGTAYCAIYRWRPLNCRKYPRTRAEHITTDTCGFHFDDL
jgi:Fe-S-cluster containining protein